jgi:hypothetical protein
VFDAWGFERCLWGTDWTRAFAVVNYEQAVEAFRRTDRLSDSDTRNADGRCLRQRRARPHALQRHVAGAAQTKRAPVSLPVGLQYARPHVMAGP